MEVMGIYGEAGIGTDAIELIEVAGRTCYKSESKITESSARKFVSSILSMGHESVIEHSAMTVKFIVDRGVTHELVRHRLCAFSQESTRYCNYKGGVTFVIPPWTTLEEGEWNQVGNAILPIRNGLTITEAAFMYTKPDQQNFLSLLLKCEKAYQSLLVNGWPPQQARSVLPNSLKTEIVVTANFREWRHIFKLRTSKAAHHQMREIMIPLLAECKRMIPVIFDDIEPNGN